MYTHIYIQIILERPSTCSHQTNPLYFRSKLAIIGRCLARATKYDAWDVRFISLLHYFQNDQIVTPNIVVIDLYSWQISVCHKTITVTGHRYPVTTPADRPSKCSHRTYAVWRQSVCIFYQYLLLWGLGMRRVLHLPLDGFSTLRSLNQWILLIYLCKMNTTQLTTVAIINNHDQQ